MEIICYAFPVNFVEFRMHRVGQLYLKEPKIRFVEPFFDGKERQRTVRYGKGREEGTVKDVK